MDLKVIFEMLEHFEVGEGSGSKAMKTNEVRFEMIADGVELMNVLSLLNEYVSEGEF
jgi:hypothetical protein